MYKKLWENFYSAVCSIHFYDDNGIKLNSLSGFKVLDFIITDELIYNIQRCEEVSFHFVKEDGFSIRHEIKLPFHEFTERICHKAEYESEGYALIDFQGLDTSEIPSLPLELSENYRIGQEIAVIGYHTEHDNLNLKKGIISFFYKSANEKYLIQFDAFIKQGNSGSPLIDLNTGKVIGVVGQRLSSITKSYEAFKNIIDENLKLLKKSEGKMNILDIDPIQVLIVNQNQLKQISKEFYRSLSMSYGYAYPISNISNYIPINPLDTGETEKNKALSN